MGHRRGVSAWRLGAGAVLAVAFLALATASRAGASGAATTFTVSGFGDGTGSCGVTDANGNSSCTTLRAAVVAAGKQANAPTIELQAGTFQLTAGNGGQLDLASSMNIVGAGPGGPNGTTIQQTDGQNRVLEISGTTKLSGLEITGGHLAPPWSSGGIASGGGILVLGTLNLQDALVTGNQALGGTDSSGNGVGDEAQGGGIDFPPGAGAGSAISDSTISGNSATGGNGGHAVGVAGGTGALGRGGGINFEGTGALNLANSTVSGNQALGGSGGTSGGPTAGAGGRGLGGGLFDAGGLTATADLVVGNQVMGGAGGGNAAAGGAAGGGGIDDVEAGETIVNATVFGNRAAGGAGPGAGGIGTGGGLLASGSSAALILASDTIDANGADTDGNLFVNVGTSPPFPFAIHDTIVAGGAPGNCEIVSPAASESYNLEDDAGQCGFSAANRDILGANPQLPSSLADNGGLAQTLAPAPGSPVLGTGGQCLDPTSTPPNRPLTVDQRGLPRPTPCDIGGFQAQPPRNTEAPQVFGSAARGQTLICSQGTWTGDGPFTFAFAWLRNGVPIQGARTNSYVVGAPDPGQSLACRVTVAHYGSVDARSPFVIVTSYPVITLLKLSVGPTRVLASLGCRGNDGQRCTGALTLTLVEKLRGRKVVGVAAAQRRSVRLARHPYTILARHTRVIRLTLSRAATGLLARFKTLPVKLAVTQTTAAGTRAVVSRSLKIRPAGRARRG